jgi:hypothetical protein
MNDLVLFLIIAGVLIAENLLIKKIAQPARLYISLGISAALIALIWLANSGADTNLKMLLSAFPLANALTSYMRYNSQKQKTQNKTAGKKSK